MTKHDAEPAQTKVIQDDREAAETYVRECGPRVLTFCLAAAFARHRLATTDRLAAELAEARAEVERLREAIDHALQCTPTIKYLPKVPSATIVYDCGDPWEILQAALQPKEGCFAPRQRLKDALDEDRNRDTASPVYHGERGE